MGAILGDMKHRQLAMTYQRRVGARGVVLPGGPTANNGTACSPAERRALGLDGLLPPAVETLEEVGIHAH